MVKLKGMKIVMKWIGNDKKINDMKVVINFEKRKKIDKKFDIVKWIK